MAFTVVRVTRSHIMQAMPGMGATKAMLPPNPVGFAALDGAGEVVGVGFVAEAHDGRMWGVAHVTDRLMPAKHLIHRHAMQLVTWCQMQGVDLYVTRDPRFKRSRQWLNRLGFVQTTEFVNDQEVWKCPA